MASYQPLASYYSMFLVHNPTTGAVQNADTTPRGYGYKNGVYDSSFAITVSNVSTGLYKNTGTIPSNTSNSKYDVLVEAYVNGIQDISVVDSFIVGPDQVNATYMNGYAITVYPGVNVTQINGLDVSTNADDLATLSNQTTMINHLTQIKGANFDPNTDALEKLSEQIQYGYTYGGGGTGDATLANQTTILSYLNDIKGPTFDQATDALDMLGYGVNIVSINGQLAQVAAGVNVISVNGEAVTEVSEVATIENQTTIINHLTQIKGNNFDPNTDSLEKLHEQIQYGYTYSSGGTGSGTATIENQVTMLNHLTQIKGATFDSNTDSLEKLHHQIEAGYAYNATLADDAITASKFDEFTAFPLKSMDSGDTAVARKGPGTHTLTTLNTAIDAVPTASEIIDAWLAETPTAGNVATIKDILLTLYSMARGKLVKNGTVFTFFDDDDSTVLFTVNITPEQRTPQ